MNYTSKRISLISAALSAMLLVSGCSTLPETSSKTIPPLRTYEDVVKKDSPRLLEISDSMEGFNRGAYRFNYNFDKYFFIPVVRTYEFILPDYVEDRVSNAINNIGEFGNLTNNLFQLKFKDAGITLSRFAINTTIGIAGLWDPATSFGLERQSEDFGQTLGHYGTGNGSYIVLPIAGPSNVRDTAGMVVDGAIFTFVGPSAWVDDQGISNAYTATYAVDKRHRIPFRYRQTGSPFEYELVRMLYTMKRDFDIAQ
ncbi:VacJ family lipoprotein [Geobacter sp.]|uniref:MlaA family lipoprotein n=1 Tax=Geobacter sp. TaxID=46610 RepID=UPI0027BAA40C|nr:VacJ family lipoprotein [Geobacter sp.]